jgi:hypothetical protein
VSGASLEDANRIIEEYEPEYRCLECDEPLSKPLARLGAIFCLDHTQPLYRSFFPHP